MTRRAPELSVVTVFWNGADDVPAYLRALESARAALPFAVELVAVDNASSDGTADLVEELAPWARVVRNPVNEGFAGGCNSGLAAAGGRFVLLLNPDCEATGPALESMVRFLRRHRRAGAVGCTLVHADGLPQYSYHSEPSWLNYWRTHSLVSGLCLAATKWAHRAGVARASRPLAVDWLMGACLMTRREVVEQVGALDAGYFMYSEDADWCRRMRDAGWRVVYLPGVGMVHHQGSTSRRRPEFTFRRLYRSMLLYVGKHRPGVPALAFRAAVVLDLALRIPIYRIHGDSERLESVRRVIAMMRANDPDLFPEQPPGVPEESPDG